MSPDSSGVRRKSGRKRPRQSSVSDPLVRCLIILCGIFGVLDLALLHEGVGNAIVGDIGIAELGRQELHLPIRQRRQYADLANEESGTGDGAASAKLLVSNKTKNVLKAMDLGNGESSRVKGILRRAGIKVNADLFSKLPKWSDMTAMYGPQPVILGLERCELFRKSVGDPTRALIGPAGMFNTGTNLLEQLLYRNCEIPGSRIRINGIRRNVPWGKHTPASYRLRFNATQDGNVSHTDTLAVVMVKDPFSWMNSMCRHPYAVGWNHVKEHCPNLVPNEVDHKHGIFGQGRSKVVPVGVRYKEFNVTLHTSLVGLWNDWYSEYHDVTWPRLIVRFEDLLFYPEFVLTKICQCAGGKIRFENFIFLGEPAKGGTVNKDSSGLLTAIMKYGTAKHRVAGFTDDDIAFAKKHVRADLMVKLNYSYPDQR